MLLLLLKGCSSRDQLTSYKNLMTKIIWTTPEGLLFPPLGGNAKNDGNDDSDDDTHSRNYGGLGPNFKNRLDWKVKLDIWENFHKWSSLRNLNTTGSKERERERELRNGLAWCPSTQSIQSSLIFNILASAQLFLCILASYPQIFKTS